MSSKMRYLLQKFAICGEYKIEIEAEICESVRIRLYLKFANMSVGKLLLFFYLTMPLLWSLRWLTSFSCC